MVNILLGVTGLCALLNVVPVPQPEPELVPTLNQNMVGRIVQCRDKEKQSKSKIVKSSLVLWMANGDRGLNGENVPKNVEGALKQGRECAQSLNTVVNHAEDCLQILNLAIQIHVQVSITFSRYIFVHYD